MKQILYLLLFIFSLSCNGGEDKIKSLPEKDNTPPSAVLKIDTTDGQQFRVVIQEGEVVIPLSESEIQLADSFLHKQIEEYNQNLDISNSIDLSKYRRQYFTSINRKGEKQLEINCFCLVLNNNEWRQKRVDVKDGGNCFFHLIVNLTTRKILGFYLNGEA